MSEPLAYLLTWTTYGTWLHGDVRGSVDRSNASSMMEYHPPGSAWEAASRRRMKHPVLKLDATQRNVVERAIADHCSIRDWQLIAVSCRTNHVHALVRTDGTAPEVVMKQLKAYATRYLRDAGWADLKRVSTRGGSIRYVKSRAALDSAIQYVRFQ